MNPNAAYLGVLVRAVILMFAGDGLDAEGEKSVSELVAAILAALTIIWSLYQKWAANKLLKQAIDAPAGASIEDIKARQ